MAPRYFSVDEANEQLAAVRPLAERMVEHRRKLAAALERQERLEATIRGNGGGIPAQEPDEIGAAVESEAAGIARCIEGIHELGALVKDVERGLVDFPALREGEEVLLCWQVGEERIEYWHGLEDGFAGREPL